MSTENFKLEPITPNRVVITDKNYLSINYLKQINLSKYNILKCGRIEITETGEIKIFGFEIKSDSLVDACLRIFEYAKDVINYQKDNLISDQILQMSEQHHKDETIEKLKTLDVSKKKKYLEKLSSLENVEYCS